ncbi:MAG: hypothetical protein ACHQKY_10430 [Terriglobia bacterium]
MSPTLSDALRRTTMWKKSMSFPAGRQFGMAPAKGVGGAVAA